MNILLIDDNHEFRNLIKTQLPYNVYTATDIKEALLLSAKVDIILLDVHLTEGDSYLSIMKLKNHFKALVLAISSDEHKESKLKMLKAGACDYIEKPLDLELLTLKLNNLIVDTKFNFSDISLNYDTFMLNEQIKLTKNETLILKLLITENKLVTKKDILRNLWNYEVFAEENAINMTISRLRKKISIVSTKVIIKSIRNQGYLIQEIHD